jgi:hypothetical protein
MLSAFLRALTERLKALFATGAALELEAESLARDAERQAELLRQAQRYDTEGLHGIADHLRRQAQALSAQRSLAGVLPAVALVQAEVPAVTTQSETSAPAALALPGLDAPKPPRALPRPRKKGAKP